MLKHSPPIPCRNDWNGTITSSNIDDINGIASLALVDDVHAEVEFGMDEDQDELSVVPGDTPQLIVARLLAARESSVIRNALKISQRPIERGDRHSDIWNSRFHSLASAASPQLKKVAIIDRYTVEQQFKCPQNQLSGLASFLRLLDRDAGGVRYVTVYSAWTADLKGKKLDDVEDEMDHIIQGLSKTNVKRLEVHMVPKHEFGKISRDRYVRFGKYAWELGHGLDVFERPGGNHFCQASFKSDVESHLHVERELERATTPSAIVINRQAPS